MDNGIVFHKRFHEAISEQGITLKELSERTGITQTKLKSYCTKRTPGARDLTKLVMVLRVSSDYLLGLSEEK